MIFQSAIISSLMKHVWSFFSLQWSVSCDVHFCASEACVIIFQSPMMFSVVPDKACMITLQSPMMFNVVLHEACMIIFHCAMMFNVCLIKHVWWYFSLRWCSALCLMTCVWLWSSYRTPLWLTSPPTPTRPCPMLPLSPSPATTTLLWTNGTIMRVSSPINIFVSWW